MTYGQGWIPPPTPPPPPRPPRRYAPKWIWVGAAAGILLTIGFPLLGLAGWFTDLGGVAPLGAGVGLMIPLVIGIVLTAMEGSPARRGFGLGVIIGWGLAPIVFAGVCVLVIIGAYSWPEITR